MFNLVKILPQKVSWILLISLFIFDNLFSYHAVTKLNGKEANLIIARYVEMYPLLYFICIPAQIIIISLIVKFLGYISTLIFNKHQLNKMLIERTILTSLVIYWIIANSSMNLAFLFDHRQSINTWLKFSAIGISLAIIFYFLSIIKLIKVKNGLKK